MSALSAAELLDVWEAGSAQTPAERALGLLEILFPEASRGTLNSLSIGSRDAELLRLREGLFGPRMAAVMPCRNCQERLELDLDTRDFLAAAVPAPQDEIVWSEGELTMTFRVPNSSDAIAAAKHAEAAGGAFLIERCFVSAQQGGAPLNPSELPTEIAAGIAGRMVEADPLADIQLALTCPSCEFRWNALFDIVSFLWTEIEVWAWRMLSDVHTLARAYGWREQDILGLSPTRRQFYLDMVGA